LIVVGSMDTDVGRIGDIVILIGSDKITMHCLTDSALRAGRVISKVVEVVDGL